METAKKCLRCGGEMVALGTRTFQLGQVGFLFGHMSNLMSGAMELELFACNDCGKVEFYMAELALRKQQREGGDSCGATDSIAQVTCPDCGRKYDMDFPRCPSCNAKNSTL